MSQSTKQSVVEQVNQVTNYTDEVLTTLLKSGFSIIETCAPNDRNYELRHWRASGLRFQHDGSIFINARNRESFAPNAGYIHTHSTGQTHIVADHDILISAKGYAKTGGGSAGSQDEKSLQFYGAGDIHIQSDGKGGVYITAKNIEFSADNNIILKAGNQVSINTGSQDKTSSLGLSKSIGSGKLSISTGTYELATASYKETVTASRQAENYGEVLSAQKMSPTKPAATGESAHITTTETVGSLVHKIGHDYILEVDGKMLLKVNNNPVKRLGPLNTGEAGYSPQPDAAFKQQIKGSRQSILTAGTTPPFAQDLISIDRGNWYCEVKNAAPGNTAISAGSVTKGDIVLRTSSQGNIGIQAGSVPSNVVLIQNSGGSIREEALGAKGMIEMKATQEIRGTAIRINLN